MMTNSFKSEVRPNYLDWAKAIGIFLVIFGHYAGVLQVPFSNNLLWNNTYNVTLFHMPLFFVIAGMLFKVRPINEELKKGVHGLMIPYFLISVICVIVYSVIKMVSVKQFLLLTIGVLSGYDFFHYANCWGEASGALWFVWSLFCIKIMVSLYYHLIKMEKTMLAYGMIVLYLITATLTVFKGNIFPFRIDSSSIGILFFIIGFKGKYYLEKIHHLNIGYLLLTTGIALLILAISAYYNIDYDTLGSKPTINRCTWGNSFLLLVISGISGTVLVFSLSRLLSCIKSKIIMNISNGTIIILGFHVLFFQFFKGIIVSDNFLVALLLSLFNLGFCYIMIILSKKYFPVLLGGRM